MIRTSSIRASLLGLLLAHSLAVPVSASPLFEDRNPNVWVVEPQTQALIPLTAGRWLESYFDNGLPIQPLIEEQQALVNGLPFSLRPMMAGQPAISIAGLGESRGTIGSGPARRPLLQVWPASGDFTQTVAVDIGIDPAEFNNRARLPLRIQRSDRSTRVLQLCGTADTNCQPAQPLQDGTRGVREFVVVNGVVNVEVSLLSAQNQPVATETRRYGMNADDPNRDSDGDGIPDLIEAAIGLDPTRSDFDQDRDGDGWSDVDEWLRCPVAYAADDSCPAVDDENLSPIDSDEDGWSDLDEQWRGTRENDPEPQLDAIEGEERRQVQRLRFKEYPNARRLYEREYRFNAVPLQPKAGTEDTAFIDATAHLPNGQRVWRLDERLTNDEVLAAGLNASELRPGVLRETADLRLKDGQLPVTRAPAGDGLVVDAWQPVNQHIQTYKRVLPALPDADLFSFLATDPEWTTVKEFRDAYIDWLRAELVVMKTGVAAALDLASTRTAHALERLLTDEARLLEAPAPIVFNSSIPERRRPWLDGFLDVLNANAAPQGGLTRLIAQLDRALAADGPLSEIGAFIDAQTAPNAVPAGLYADLWLAQRFDDSSPVLEAGCTITVERLALLQQDPQAYAEFLALCPDYRTDDALAEQAALDLTRRFGLRTLLLFDIGDLLADSSLLDPDADSDGDGVTNLYELARRPLPQASHPLLVDSDGDGVADGNDPCPNDPLNACLGRLFAPRLMPVSDVTVREDTPGGVAAVVLFLDRAGTEAALVQYQAFSDTADTATADEDYQALSGVLRLAPGSTRGVISIPVAYDDEAEAVETFTLRLTPLSGVIGATRDVRISIIDVEPSTANDPPLAIADAPAQVAVGDTVELDGRGSVDPLGRGLRYDWTQLDGFEVALDGADDAVASFTAPAVTVTETLVFRLRVTDADDRSSETSVSVDVRAPGGNRPPELLRWPYEAEVALGETLRIDDADILAMVLDPDDDPLYLWLQNAPAGGDIGREDDYYLFRPYRGIVPVTPAGQRVFNVKRSGERQVVTSVDLPPNGSEIWVYDGDTDAAPRRLAAGGNPAAVQGTPWVYLLQGEGAQTLARVNLEDPAAGIEDLGIPFDSTRMSTAKVDPQYGALYYCHPGAPGSDAVYARIAVGSTAPEFSEQRCDAFGSGGGEDLSTVASTQGFCFMAGDRLLCRDDGPAVLREVQRFQGRVIALQGVERFLAPSRLRVIEDDFSGGLRFWDLIGTVAASQPQMSMGNASVPRGGVVRNLADLYVPVETDVFGENRTMQLYRWSFLGTPEPITAPQSRGDFASGSGGFTVDDEGLLYWFRLDASPPATFGARGTARLMQLDPSEYQASGSVFATFRELVAEEVRVGGHTDRIVHDGRGLVMQLALADGFGQCRLSRVSTFGPPQVEVIADVMLCSDGDLFNLRPRLPSSLLFFKQVVAGQDALVRFDGVSVIDATSPGSTAEVEFDITVSDPEGASVEVPVRITVKEEGTP